MAKAYVLTEQDLLTIRAMARDYRARMGAFSPASPGTRYQPEEPDLVTPECYVARVPSAGIPALTEAAGASIEDVPGSAECDIYFLGRVGATGSLRKYPALRQRVWNLSGTAISGSTWALVVRDKGGAWFALSTQGGFTGSQTIVTGVSCSGSTLTVTTKVFTWVEGRLQTVV